MGPKDKRVDAHEAVAAHEGALGHEAIPKHEAKAARPDWLPRGLDESFAGLAPNTYEQFRRIDPKKQERIVRAALEEFSTRSYREASTNRIVAAAGISKGLLFHYFGDKAGLCRYLIIHVMQVFYGEMFTLYDRKSNDVFEIISWGTRAKMEIAVNYKLESDFYLRLLTSDLPPELESVRRSTLAQSYTAFDSLVTQLDARLLKDGIDKDIVVRLVAWVSRGLSEDLIKRVGPRSTIEDVSAFMPEVEDVFDLLKRLLYKNATLPPPATPTTATDEGGEADGMPSQHTSTDQKGAIS
ncbi:MAG: TetR/AcrR family transcriptional regulator [Coriobacteriales bacterium]|jgi:AcrR family transcriptional regulator|nr:TetR/AcrR family transcriptional regulator [Coriobacteriales bacterium]